MFQKLADFIIHHYKLVILTWIVVIFYSFPLIFNMDDVTTYSETEAGLEEMEAMLADEAIAENFPGRIANSTITIVIQNSNITTEDVRDATSDLYSTILTSGRLHGVQSVDYVYSAVESYVAGVVIQTSPMMYSLYAQTNQTALMVYGTPLEAVGKHMAFLTLGYTDEEARTAVVLNITEELLAQGMDSTMVAYVMGYVDYTFYPLWLSSHTTDPAELQVLIVAASDQYFGLMTDAASQFALGVAHCFTVADFAVPESQLNHTFGILSYEMVADVGFLSSIWALGPTPSLSEMLALAHETVFSYPLEELPLYVPDLLISQFVNLHPMTPPARTTMLMAVSLSVSGSSSEAEANVRELRAMVDELLAPLGDEYSVYVTGDAALNVDTMDAVEEDVSRIDPVTVFLVIFLVALFFRSAVSPWIPLLTIGMAYVAATAAVFILASTFMNIHYSVMTFVLVVMLGAGTDYCIFIMSRYREERIQGRPKEEAVKTSLMWAGESIATSGITVMIGFGALMISDYSMIRSIGMALVASLGITLAFALTMLPALLMLVGDKVFWPNTMTKESARVRRLDERGGGYFRKSAEFSLKHSKAIVVAALVISLPAVYLFLSLEPSYDFMSSLPNAESKQGIDAMGAGFGEGTIMPTHIVITYDRVIVENGTLNATAASEIEEYCSYIADPNTIGNVRSVAGPTRPFGEPVNETFLDSLPSVERATYDMAISQRIGIDGRTVLLVVILQDEPFTTDSIHTIDHLRAYDEEAVESVFGGDAEILVGGSTAGMADVSRTVSEDFTTMRFVVLVGIYVVLLVVLGSVLIPLRLIMTVLLNVTWTVAATMLVFLYASGDPVLWMMPLILFVVAMGLGMDYDIFLTTRIREEVSKGKTDAKAITTAVERTGGIITACGLVMAGAFGSMMLSTTVLLREFGFGLAFAILLDAMILRIYLVPAIMLLLQRWNWYAPGRLQRVRREQKGREQARKH